MFEVDEIEWHTCLGALSDAGLVQVRWESPTRATIIFTKDAQS